MTRYSTDIFFTSLPIHLSTATTKMVDHIRHIPSLTSLPGEICFVLLVALQELEKYIVKSQKRIYDEITLES